VISHTLTAVTPGGEASRVARPFRDVPVLNIFHPLPLAESGGVGLSRQHQTTRRARLNNKQFNTPPKKYFSRFLLLFLFRFL
jgi:hypothetical protein